MKPSLLLRTSQRSLMTVEDSIKIVGNDDHDDLTTVRPHNQHHNRDHNLCLEKEDKQTNKLIPNMLKHTHKHVNTKVQVLKHPR